MNNWGLSIIFLIVAVGAWGIHLVLTARVYYRLPDRYHDMHEGPFMRVTPKWKAWMLRETFFMLSFMAFAGMLHFIIADDSSEISTWSIPTLILFFVCISWIGDGIDFAHSQRDKNHPIVTFSAIMKLLKEDPAKARLSPR